MTNIQLGKTSFTFRDLQLFDEKNKPLALRAKSTRVLEVLMRSSGQIVSKDSLADAAWPGVVATDESISQCISDIRKALGDTSHSLLETIPKRGYRINPSAAKNPVPTVGFTWPRLIVACAVAGVALLVVLFRNDATIDNDTNLPLRNIVAVLPFEDQSSIPEADEYLAVGLAEDLIIHLGDLSDLRMVPPSATLLGEDPGKSSLDMARTLGARFVVSGTIYQTKETVRVTIQLVDAKDQTIVWAGKHEGVKENLLVYRDEILISLTTAMSVALSDRERERLERPETQNPHAYDQVLQGRLAVSSFTFKGNLAAERHFRNAISDDPNYARAYAELAAALAIRLENNWQAMTAADEEKAFYFANKAAKLDPDLWLAQYALGRLHVVVSKPDLNAAERHLMNAMSLQPDNDDARVFYAAVKDFQGDAETTISIMEAVLQTHPNPPFWYYLSYGVANFLLERHEDAAKAFDKCLQQLPNAPYCLRYQIANFVYLEQMDDAEWAIEEYRMLGYEASISAMMDLTLVQAPADRELIASALREAGLPD